MGWLKSIYDSIPLVREVRRIMESVARTELCVSQLASAQVHSQIQSLLEQPRYCESNRLHRYEFQVYSQSGEDGVIREIFKRLQTPPQRVVEIGVNGLESITLYPILLGASGVWIDGDASAVSRMTRDLSLPIREGRLRMIHAMVSAENAERLLLDADVPVEFDMLSVDIDRNTYFVWESLQRFRPRVVVIEYNATFPPDVAWKVEYHEDRVWNGTTYFGASLKALELLGSKMGYNLIGCSMSGVNAFFVRSDLCGDHFAKPFTAENHYEPPRYWIIARNLQPRGFSDD